MSRYDVDGYDHVTRMAVTLGQVSMELQRQRSRADTLERTAMRLRDALDASASAWEAEDYDGMATDARALLASPEVQALPRP